MGEIFNATFGETISYGDLVGYDMASGKWKKAGSIQTFYTQGVAAEDGINNEVHEVELFGSVVNTPIYFNTGVTPEATQGYIMQPVFDVGQANIFGNVTQINGWRNPFLGYLLTTVSTSGQIGAVFSPDNPRYVTSDIATKDGGGNAQTAQQTNDVWYDRLADALSRNLIMSAHLPNANRFIGFTHQANTTKYYILTYFGLLALGSGNARLKIKTYMEDVLLDDTGYILQSMTNGAILYYAKFIDTSAVGLLPNLMAVTVNIERDGGNAADTVNANMFVSPMQVLM